MKMSYQHILVGLDLSNESEQVINKVQTLFKNSSAKISLIHVLEPLSFAYGGDIPMDLSRLQSQLEEQAISKLAEAGQKLSVAKEHQYVIIGQPAQEMHRFAKENGVDLMVLGTHGRHGLSLLFGSTANGVLHGAPCDVFAVLIKES